MRSKGEGTIRFDERRQEWIGAVMYNGKRKFFYSGKGGKRRDVVQKMDEFKTSHNKEIYATKKENLSQRLDNWLNTIKKQSLKPSSFDRLESIINCQIKPRIGDYTLDEITDTVIKDELIDAMANEGLSISSQKKAYNAMHEYLNYAVYMRAISFSPMGLMKQPQEEGYIDANSSIEEDDEDNNINPLNEEERNLLREWAYARWKRPPQNLRYPTAAGYILIMNTGMRIGEALALKWSDVDLDNSIIHVTKNLIVIKNRDDDGPKQKAVIQNTPKSKKSRRDIPLNKEALAALESLKQTPGTTEKGFVIHTITGTVILPRNFEATLDTLCKNAGLRKIGVHTLRHTYATRLYEKGIDVKVISELLGHSSVGVTYSVYLHIFESMKRTAVQALDLD